MERRDGPGCSKCGREIAEELLTRLRGTEMAKALSLATRAEVLELHRALLAASGRVYRALLCDRASANLEALTLILGLRLDTDSTPQAATAGPTDEVTEPSVMVIELVPDEPSGC